MLKIVDWRCAIHKPCVRIALNDLYVIFIRDEVAHNGRHDVVDRDDAYHQCIFIENDGKVGMRALEDVEDF